MTKSKASLSIYSSAWKISVRSSHSPLPVLEMIAKVTTVKAHNIWLTSGDETRRKAAIEFVVKGLETGALKPVIDRTFAFDEMADVHRYLERSGQFGKIVVTV